MHVHALQHLQERYNDLLNNGEGKAVHPVQTLGEADYNIGMGRRLSAVTPSRGVVQLQRIFSRIQILLSVASFYCYL
jgi:hypothetical protein